MKMETKRIMVNRKNLISLFVKTFTVLVILSIIISFGIMVVSFGEPPKNLFTDVPRSADLDVKHEHEKKDPTIMRSRHVKVNFDYLDEKYLPKGVESIILNLFDDVIFKAVKNRIEKRAKDQYTWFGSIENTEHSQVILVVENGIMAGNIIAEGRVYQIRALGDGVHSIREIDQSLFPDEAPPLKVPNVSEDNSSGIPQLPQINDGCATNIDVMVVFTPDAALKPGITSEIQLAIDDTNQSYENSGINQRLRLVNSEQIDYTESGDISTALDRLQGLSDGYMDNVHTLRDSYAADLVCLWVKEGGEYAGIAYLMNTVSNSFKSYAFSVVQRSYATGGYTFAHELGHNMGAQHDRLTDNSPGAYDYSHGYINKDICFYTIMAYQSSCEIITVPYCENCTRIPYWSNPEVMYNGYPTGVAEGLPNSADNRKTLNNTAYTVSNFRNPVAPYVSTKMTVDGNLSESAWDIATDICKRVVLEKNPLDDNTAKFGVLWDSTYLYVGVKVLDDNLYHDSRYYINNEYHGDLFRDDSVEIVIDPDNSGGLLDVNNYDRSFLKGSNNNFLDGDKQEGVLHVWTSIPGGYSIEMAIPWTNLGIIPTAGMTIGFSVGYNDDDDGNDREVLVVWQGTAENSWDTSALGEIVLGALPPNLALAPYVSTKMTVDGNLSESDWDIATDISKRVVVEKNPLDDNTAKFGVLWDSTYLYVGVKVLDGYLYHDSRYYINNEYHGDLFRDDSVEIAINGDNNRDPDFDDHDRYFLKGSNNNFLDGLKQRWVLHVWTSIPGGYSIEMAIPWTNLGIIPTAGMTIGFSVGYNDDDDGNDREVLVVWQGTGDNYTDTSALGEIVLGAPLTPEPQIINDIVTFEPITSTYRTTYGSTTACGNEFVGQFSFDARLTNKTNIRVSQFSLSDLVVKVLELAKGNLLQNADGGAGGVGSSLTVKNAGDYDGKLEPGKSVDVPFIICLKKKGSFVFVVDVLGIKEAVSSQALGSPQSTDTEPRSAKFKKGSRIARKGFFGRFRP